MCCRNHCNRWEIGVVEIIVREGMMCCRNHCNREE